MARSTLTVAELQAQAMLLGDGWSYDADDHTFNKRGEWPMLDADTLEEIRVSRYKDLNRFQYVVCGQLGAVDYDQWKKELLGYD